MNNSEKHRSPARITVDAAHRSDFGVVYRESLVEINEDNIDPEEEPVEEAIPWEPSLFPS